MTGREMKAKIGHPLMDPGLGLLSADDEKMLDPRGHQIADKTPWSQSHSGMWLTLFGYAGGAAAPSTAKARRLPNGLTLLVMAGPEKPAFAVPGWGASLELPADLPHDKYKRQYVTEWVVDTIKEILVGSKSTVGDAADFQAWVVIATDEAIRSCGF